MYLLYLYWIYEKADKQAIISLFAIQAHIAISVVLSSYGSAPPLKKASTLSVLFSMISVPYGTGDISLIWYPLSADDICLRHIRGTDIISCLRSKYIIRRKPYIILRQQYIMKHEAHLRHMKKALVSASAFFNEIRSLRNEWNIATQYEILA